MKKAIGLLLCGVFACSAAIGLAGCGAKLPADAIVVYKEYNGLAGREDEKVKEAIEKKFLEDTGESITLMVEPHDTSSLGNKITGGLGAGERIDAIVMHYSSDSSLTSMITEESELKDLTEMISEYAPDYSARFNDTTDPDRLAYRKGMYNGKIYAMSSLEHTSIFGMLVNKSHMALTDFNPDEYNVANEGYKSLTIGEFTTMLEQMKARVDDGLNRPLGGAPYDIGYFLEPVFGCTSYTRMELIGDKLYPAWATENFCDLLEYERMLQEKKLWTDNPLASVTVDRDFTAGRVSVYAPYPEVTQMIEMSKKLKKATGDDCVMLAPLRAEGEAESKGNARHESAFLGMVVPKKTAQNTELLLKYMNWLSKEENYELAKYGIEGTHWEKTTLADGRAGYAYPEDKRAEYEESAPYSGVYCLLTDVNLSDRTYAGYTSEQQAWVREVHAFKSYPEHGYDDEGINLPSVPGTNRTLTLVYRKMSNEYVGVRAFAWSDAPLGDQSITERHSALTAKLADGGEYSPYITFITEEYNKIKQSFQKN